MTPSSSKSNQMLIYNLQFSASIENLPKLLEDIVETSINTGPRGPIRLAQGIQAFLGVGREWLADVTKVSVLSLFVSTLPLCL